MIDLEKKIISLEHWLNRKIKSTNQAVGNHLSTNNINKSSIENKFSLYFPTAEIHKALNIETKELAFKKLINFENSRFYMRLKKIETAESINKINLPGLEKPNHFKTAFVSANDSKPVSLEKTLNSFKRELGNDLKYYPFSGFPRNAAVLFNKSNLQHLSFYRSKLSISYSPLQPNQYMHSWSFSDRKVYNQKEIQKLIEDHIFLDISYSFSFDFYTDQSFYFMELD